MPISLIGAQSSLVGSQLQPQRDGLYYGPTLQAALVTPCAAQGQEAGKNAEDGAATQAALAAAQLHAQAATARAVQAAEGRVAAQAELASSLQILVSLTCN